MLEPFSHPRREEDGLVNRAHEVASWDACFHRVSHLAETTHTGAAEGCHQRHSVRIESFFPAFLHKHHTGVLCKVGLKELAFDADTRENIQSSSTPPRRFKLFTHPRSSFPLIIYC